MGVKGFKIMDSKMYIIMKLKSSFKRTHGIKEPFYTIGSQIPDWIRI